MKKLSESRKQLLNDKEQSSPVVRISKKQFEDLEAAAFAYFGLSGHLFRFHPARRFGVIRPA